MMYYEPQILDLTEISPNRPIYIKLHIGAEPQLFCVQSVEPIRSFCPTCAGSYLKDLGGYLAGLNIYLNAMEDPYAKKG